jgi:hypothetical protein
VHSAVVPGRCAGPAPWRRRRRSTRAHYLRPVHGGCSCRTRVNGLPPDLRCCPRRADRGWLEGDTARSSRSLRTRRRSPDLLRAKDGPTVARCASRSARGTHEDRGERRVRGFAALSDRPARWSSALGSTAWCTNGSSLTERRADLYRGDGGCRRACLSLRAVLPRGARLQGGPHRPQIRNLLRRAGAPRWRRSAPSSRWGRTYFGLINAVTATARFCPRGRGLRRRPTRQLALLERPPPGAPARAAASVAAGTCGRCTSRKPPVRTPRHHGRAADPVR